MTSEEIVEQTILKEADKIKGKNNNSKEVVKKDDQELFLTKDKKACKLVALTDDMLDSIPKDKKVPEFVNTFDYQMVFTWLCLPEKDRIPITHLVDQLTIVRSMIYKYIGHWVTKYLLEYYIQHQLVNRDRLILYESQKDTAKHNPHMARFVAERYDNYTPKSGNNIPITINIGFLGGSHDAVDAEIVTDEEQG